MTIEDIFKYKERDYRAGLDSLLQDRVIYEQISTIFNFWYGTRLPLDYIIRRMAGIHVNDNDISEYYKLVKEYAEREGVYNFDELVKDNSPTQDDPVSYYKKYCRPWSLLEKEHPAPIPAIDAFRYFDAAKIQDIYRLWKRLENTDMTLEKLICIINEDCYNDGGLLEDWKKEVENYKKYQESLPTIYEMEQSWDMD